MVSSHTIRITRADSTLSFTCNIAQVEPEQQVAIEVGDVYAGYLRADDGQPIPVVAQLSTEGNRTLYRDGRSPFSINQFPILNRSYLGPVKDLGLHIYAEIGMQ